MRYTLYFLYGDNLQNFWLIQAESRKQHIFVCCVTLKDRVAASLQAYSFFSVRIEIVWHLCDLVFAMHPFCWHAWMPASHLWLDLYVWYRRVVGVFLDPCLGFDGVDLDDSQSSLEFENGVGISISTFFNLFSASHFGFDANCARNMWCWWFEVQPARLVCFLWLWRSHSLGYSTINLALFSSFHLVRLDQCCKWCRLSRWTLGSCTVLPTRS